VLPARAALFGLAALLTGCAAVPGAVAPSADALAQFEAHRELLASIEDWTAGGRLSLTVSEESWSARVDWTQRGQASRLRLSGPFGQGAAELLMRPGAAELRTADDHRYSAETPEDLMVEHVGWSIPLDGLRYWLLGLPEPEVEPAVLELDDRGRISRLEQSGWTVRYLRYQSVGALEMPARLDFESPRVNGKLAVTRWELSTAVTSALR
jgi:outer membrane lipoprotein LolB